MVVMRQGWPSATPESEETGRGNHREDFFDRRLRVMTTEQTESESESMRCFGNTVTSGRLVTFFFSKVTAPEILFSRDRVCDG